MRRLVQLVSLLTLTTSGVMLAGSFTGAEASGTQTTAPTPLQTAWFWQTALEQVNPPVASGPAPANEPSGVPDGDLAVAHSSSDASSSKMSAVAFDLGPAATPGTVISKFTVSLTVDGSPSAANAGQPTVVACLPTRLWPAASGGDYTDEPPVDCSTKVPAKVNGSTYSFDITGLAQDWVTDQNVGIAFVNDPDNTQTPYQVVFTGAKTIKASMTYLPPVKAPAPGGTTAGSTGTGIGSTSTGAGGQPTSSGPVSMPPPPPSSQTGTTGSTNGPAPVVAQVPEQRIAPVAHVTPASSLPSRPFWFAAAAFALLLLGASLVLGDDVTSPTASTSRLDRVLRGRAGTTGALSARS